MTQYFLSISKSDARSIHQGKVAVAVGTPTADFFFQIDATTHTPTKEDALCALEAFRMYIMSNGVGSGNGNGTDLPAS